MNETDELENKLQDLRNIVEWVLKRYTNDIDAELAEKFHRLDELITSLSNREETSGTLDDDSIKLIMDIGLGIFGLTNS